MAVEGMLAKEEHTCRQKNSISSICVRICEPPADQPAELQIVQTAIARSVRARLEQISQPVAIAGEGGDSESCVEFRPGAGALMSHHTLDALVSLVAEHSPTQLTFPLADHEPPAGLNAPRTFETCFSVQTGADIIALSLHPEADSNLRHTINPPATSRRRMAVGLSCFTNRDAEVALVGSVHNATWRFLEDRAACRVRLFADGAPGQPGVVPAMLHQAGPESFLNWITQVGDAIFIDSRQLLVGHEQPDEVDYYYSDIGASERIKNPMLKQITEMALSCDTTLILGGPSVVNGIQFALVDAAWQANERPDRGYQIEW